MEVSQTVKSLHPLEVKILRGFSQGEEISAPVLTEKLGFNTGQSNQGISWLESKGFLEEKDRIQKTVYEITDLGKEYAEKGTPDERMLKVIAEKDPLKMPEIAKVLGLENKDVGSAFGQMAKEGLLKMGPEKKVELGKNEKSERIDAVRTVLDKAVKSNGELEEGVLTDSEKGVMSGISKKRGASSVAFKLSEREEVVYQLTKEGLSAKKALEAMGITGEEIGKLTPEILSTEEWREKGFRSYNIQIPPSRVLLGRKNPYAEYLEKTKDKLVSLGFEEFDGPLVETEFWNSDALYMPQFHSARDIHDVYYVKDPSHAKEIEQPYLDQIAESHENGWKTGSRGWQYKFDKNFTKRLIMRSHGTVLSAKQLPKAKVPGKYFGVVRCFRYDQVDATHGADFYQTEGIVLGEDVNLRTLLGLLKMFAEEVAGAKEVMYVPGYFPFTEPSVEVHIKHPVLGWFELGGAGIFRPELTQPLGINVPVLAWGLGIDRMALMSLGLNDLRELFTPDIENVRLRKRS
ncbi:MAG: phenylalanine--tRNA ligase subunit alpha [Spirochaetia bacterium]